MATYEKNGKGKNKLISIKAGLQKGAPCPAR